MILKLVERPAFTMVGQQIRTRPMSPDIPSLWPKFVRRIHEIRNVAEPGVSYGVMTQDPAGGILIYTAAVSVAKAGEAPRGMVIVHVPAGTYASFRYPLSGLAQGFTEIFSRLLPGSGHVPIDAPYLERYDADFDPGKPQSMVEICIPVATPRVVTALPEESR